MFASGALQAPFGFETEPQMPDLTVNVDSLPALPQEKQLAENLTSFLQFLDKFTDYLWRLSGNGVTYKSNHNKEGPTTMKNMRDQFILPLQRSHVVRQDIRCQTILDAVSKHLERGCFGNIDEVREYILCIPVRIMAYTMS